MREENRNYALFAHWVRKAKKKNTSNLIARGPSKA